jgi:trehalose 6-phosphate synthase
VDRTIESRVDYDRFSVTRGGKPTVVRPFPISLDPDLPQLEPGAIDDRAVARVRRQLRIRDQAILVGVDRLDYTKGIPERLRALERLLENHPEHREKIVFVELGAPSRTHIRHYRLLNEEIDELVEEINWRHGTDRWRPIVFLREHHSADKVFAMYRAAQVCVVSSLHDGMNLVAKEFIASRSDLRGVLLLSHFTGAATELEDAVLFNPYATDRFAEAIHQALTMPAEEQERRMRALREQVSENNVYRWAGTLLAEAAKILSHQR